VISAKNVLGINIYTLDQGILPEYVIDLIFNPDQNQVVAFIIGQDPLTSLQILNFENISAVGANSLIISSSYLKQRLDELPDEEIMMLNGKKSLLDKLVLTDKGGEVGRIVDLHFDSKTGQAIVLEVHIHNDWNTLLNGQRFFKTSAIRKIGRRVAIVDDQQSQGDGDTSIINRKIQSVNDFQQIVYSQIKRGKEVRD
jgi:uncharacterized protein YrrD